MHHVMHYVMHCVMHYAMDYVTHVLLAATLHGEVVAHGRRQTGTPLPPRRAGDARLLTAISSE